MSVRSVRPLSIALIAVVVAACGGPVAPIDVASREMPLDLLLGKRSRVVAEAPVAPFVIPAAAFQSGGFFADDLPSVPSTSTTTAPLPEAEEPPSDCPQRDVLVPPRLAARNVIDRPPVEAVYTYRTAGEYRNGANVYYLAPTSTWTVGNIVSERTGWTFDVSVANAGITTKTTYRVITEIVEPPGTPLIGTPRPPSPAPNPRTPGLYLAGMTDFHPPFPGMPIVHFPLNVGDVVDATASDGTTTRTHRSVIDKKAVFDACGTPIDSYVVSLTGKLVKNDPEGALQADFGEIVSLGPQYGGLFLSHRAEVVAPGAARSVDMRASQEPKEAT